MIYINGESVFTDEEIDPSISKDIEDADSVTDEASAQTPLC